jgi:alkylation response protein AidB-like acyl-CoA dehydrogenase
MAAPPSTPRLADMTSTIAINGSATASPPRTDWVELARQLGPGFAARAAAHDANDSFPVENYRELKQYKFFSAGVPVELGGGGASHRELCSMLHELGRHCGATDLAFSMHTYLVGTTVWLGSRVRRWRRCSNALLPSNSCS